MYTVAGLDPRKVQKMYTVRELVGKVTPRMLIVYTFRLRFLRKSEYATDVGRANRGTGSELFVPPPHISPNYERVRVFGLDSVLFVIKYYR